MRLFKEIIINKKLAGVLRVSGFALSYFAPKFDFDLEIMTQGLVAGLVIGLLWSLVRYYKHGESGIARSQRELSKIFVYLIYFLGGYAFGYLVFKVLLS